MVINFDSAQGFAYVKISPIKANFTDDCECVRLYVSIQDNLYSMCQLTWNMGCDDGIFRLSGYNVINDTNYTNWDGNPFYPFTFLADLMGLTIVV